jgi:RNA polymerase-binding protein DksA
LGKWWTRKTPAQARSSVAAHKLGEFTDGASARREQHFMGDQACALLNRLRSRMQKNNGLQCEEAMRTNKKREKQQKFQPFEDLLRARLAELTAHLDQLRQEVVIDDEVDDEATQAFRSNNREFVMTTMEREIRNVSEIEQALERIAKNEYGVCVTCETSIPDNRLHAIPWTRLCVDCAGGGINRNVSARGFGDPLLDSR